MVRGLHKAGASTKVRFRGSILEAQTSAHPELILSGPAGTGKSRGILEKVWRLANAHPGMRALIVRKTRASLSESALFTLEDLVLGRQHPAVVGGPQRQHRFKYVLPNSSEIAVGGMDKASRILSTEYDLIYVQEATELIVEDWETLSTRLRAGILPYQQLIADCNPGPSQHWLKKRSDDGRARMLFTKHEDNPALYSDGGELTERGRQYLHRLDRLTGVRHKRLRLGQWVSAEGVVYDAFDASVHVIDERDVPPYSRRYRVVDFGFTNPFVAQWWGEDKDSRLYLYREHYRTKTLVEDHARTILELGAAETYDAPIICDHDAEDRATLQRHTGSVTAPAFKSVRVGIEAVQARLRIQEDGRPRLYFVRSATSTVDSDLGESGKPVSSLQEIEQYVWANDQAGRPNKEEPVKEFDHGMDCVRYIVAFVDGLRSRKRRAGTWGRA
jgi:phage terminase large subunit